jgi:hypothetical protein
MVALVRPSRLLLCGLLGLVACGAFATDSEGGGTTMTDAGASSSSGGSEAGSTSGGPFEEAGAKPDGAVTDSEIRATSLVGRSVPLTNGTAGLTVPLSAIAPAGHLLIVGVVDSKGNSQPVVAVTDDNGVAFAQTTVAAYDLAPSAAIWSTIAKNDVHSIRVGVGASDVGLSVWVLDVAGFAKTDITATSQLAASTSTSELDAPAVTPSTAPELVVSIAAHDASISGIANDSGFTDVPLVGGGPTPTAAMAYRVVESSGSYAAKWSAEPGGFRACTASFKP